MKRPPVTPYQIQHITPDGTVTARRSYRSAESARRIFANARHAHQNHASHRGIDVALVIDGVEEDRVSKKSICPLCHNRGEYAVTDRFGQHDGFEYCSCVAGQALRPVDLRRSA